MRILGSWGMLAVAVFSTACGHCDEPQVTDIPSLEVVNEDGKPTAFALDQLARLPRTELLVKDRRGEEVKYAGVAVSTLLKEAGTTAGAELKGKRLADFLLIEAADKYQVVFSLPEVDPAWTDRVVLLATTRNGEPLAATHGPFQLVVSGEKLHSRWVKQVVKISVRSGLP